MDDEPNQTRNNPPIGFKPREFGLGLLVAIAIVLSVVGTRWYVRARTSAAVDSCYANLKQLDGAKSIWAINHKKLPDDVPQWTDIIGPNAYIRDMPICHRGGTYILGPVGQPPRCSIPEHTLKQ